MIERVNHVVKARRRRQLVALDAVVVAMATTWRRLVSGIVTADAHELQRVVVFVHLPHTFIICDDISLIVFT